MLKCVSRYKSSLGVFAVGDVVDDATLEAALLTDSPLSFEAVVIDAAMPVEEDKMMRRGRQRKVNEDEVIE
jgi:hypothetical protein